MKKKRLLTGEDPEKSMVLEPGLNINSLLLPWKDFVIGPGKERLEGCCGSSFDAHLFGYALGKRTTESCLKCLRVHANIVLVCVESLLYPSIPKSRCHVDSDNWATNILLIEDIYIEVVTYSRLRTGISQWCAMLQTRIKGEPVLRERNGSLNSRLSANGINPWTEFDLLLLDISKAMVAMSICRQPMLM